MWKKAGKNLWNDGKKGNQRRKRGKKKISGGRGGRQVGKSGGSVKKAAGPGFRRPAQAVLPHGVMVARQGKGGG